MKRKPENSGNIIKSKCNTIWGSVALSKKIWGNRISYTKYSLTKDIMEMTNEKAEAWNFEDVLKRSHG